MGNFSHTKRYGKEFRVRPDGGGKKSEMKFKVIMKKKNLNQRKPKTPQTTQIPTQHNLDDQQAGSTTRQRCKIRVAQVHGKDSPKSAGIVMKRLHRTQNWGTRGLRTPVRCTLQAQVGTGIAESDSTFHWTAQRQRKPHVLASHNYKAAKVPHPPPRIPGAQRTLTIVCF